MLAASIEDDLIRERALASIIDEDIRSFYGFVHSHDDNFNKFFFESIIYLLLLVVVVVVIVNDHRSI